VHDDVLTEPGDVQTMFDNIPVTDKKLQWIHGTTRRWDGYLEFQRHPEPMLDWFAKHMDLGELAMTTALEPELTHVAVPLIACFLCRSARRRHAWRTA
jgi:hypothetical protein